jgi:excisionase family DNA binding protein
MIEGNPVGKIFKQQIVATNSNGVSKADRQPSTDQKFYSPKKVATAIGVSESSLKRWCDAGYVKASKTAGGHRRVSRSEVIAFLKRKKIKLKNPQSIGLPDIRSVNLDGIQDAQRQLLLALKSGDELAARKIAVTLFVEGRNLAEIFDRVISPVFSEIGNLWRCGNLEVYEERVACQICFKALVDIESLIPQVPENAPVAVGATLEGDQYQLASTGVELCLRNFGWNAQSLGANIPIESLERAATAKNASLIWISVSHIVDVEVFKRKLTDFCHRLSFNQRVILGGSAIGSDLTTGLPNATYCENFAQLIMSASPK